MEVLSAGFVLGLVLACTGLAVVVLAKAPEVLARLPEPMVRGMPYIAIAAIGAAIAGLAIAVLAAVLAVALSLGGWALGVALLIGAALVARTGPVRAILTPWSDVHLVEPGKLRISCGVVRIANVEYDHQANGVIRFTWRGIYANHADRRSGPIDVAVHAFMEDVRSGKTPLL